MNTLLLLNQIHEHLSKIINIHLKTFIQTKYFSTIVNSHTNKSLHPAQKLLIQKIPIYTYIAIIFCI